jgi:putative transposase
MLSSYLAGANSRRIAAALKPLLGSTHLSKSAVSRVVGRLKQSFAEWSARDLSAESYPVLFLDGFHLKVRVARRVVSVPALAVMGVTLSGEKVLLSLRLAASEAATDWSGTILELQQRGLAAPHLIVVDGHQGLGKSLAAWPKAEVQRCVVHKLRNLEEHCPPHARREMQRDYDKIVYTPDGMKAREAYPKFRAKWRGLAPAVANSLEEAGEELLTFYRWPKSMWKSLRTTNPLENLNREFRRRTKTQGSFSTEDAALTLLYGLVALGHIKLRKVDGHQQLAEFVANAERSAA